VKKILGLSIDELAVPALLGDFNSKWEDEEGQKLALAKKQDFVGSVIGRLTLAYLPLHDCEKGCSPVELTAGELFIAKRPLNTRALPMLEQQFISGVRRMNSETAFPEGLREYPRDYFEKWVIEFIDAALDVLHGEFDAVELFGEGKQLDTWRRLEEFLA
jgi:hypothetical protein